MAYPILAAQDTWYKSTANRSTITQINIVDTYIPTGNENETWNADADNAGNIKCYKTGTVLTIAGNGSGKIAMNADSSWVFSHSTDYYKLLEKITGAELLDTSGVTTLERCFQNCEKLTSVNVANWDTSGVKNMKALFQLCYSLDNLDVSNWDVSGVQNMAGMFNQCKSLTSLNLSGWNVSNVTSMIMMIQQCDVLTTIGDVSNWQVGKVTSMKSMFQNCYNLTSLDVSKWDVSKVATMLAMFQNCYCLTELAVSNWNTSQVTEMDYMFNQCTALTTLDVSNWDVGNVTSMYMMFNGATSLTALDVSKWNTSKVTNMKGMFSQSDYGVTHAPFTELDVSNWDVSNVTDMGWMFYGCKGLTSIDVSKWDVSKVESLHHFIAHAYIEIKGYENWEVSSCKFFNAAFYTCINKTLDLSKWDVSNGETFGQMFEGSNSLENIKGLENWNTSKGRSFYEMFQNCPKLKTLDLSSFDTRNASTSWTDPMRDNKETGSMANMFTNAKKLEKIKIGANFSFNGDGSCPAAVFPTQLVENIDGADGNWYTLDGTAYAPSAIPSCVANTYYASIDAMDVTYLADHPSLLRLASSIRALTGSTKAMTLQEMKEEIDNVQLGGMDTSDATALADEIFLGKTAYIADGKVTGTFTIEEEISTQDDLIAQIQAALRGKAGETIENAYNQGVADGKQTEYDDFWNSYQGSNGDKNVCDYFFAGQGWTKSKMRPKSDIKPTRANQMFALNAFKGDLAQHFADLGIVLDFSNCTMTQNIFANAYYITRLGIIDFSKSTTSTGGGWFQNMKALETIDKLILSENTYLNKVEFNACANLKNITIEGSIGKTISFKDCSLLTIGAADETTNSVQSIIDALITITDGNARTLTLHQTVRNKLTPAQELTVTGTVEQGGKGWTLLPARTVTES